MKVHSAALLFLASYGTTISSSNAEVVELQVSANGEANKNNRRKLQSFCDTCKEDCTDLYCACPDVCDLEFGGDDCQNCAGSVTSDDLLPTKCAKSCGLCKLDIARTQAPSMTPSPTVVAITTAKPPASTKAPRSARRKLAVGDDGFNWDDFFQCKEVPTISPRPSMAPSISSVPSSSAAPTTDCGIIDCDVIHSASCNPDPHYSIWSGTVSYYDFQGSCDQIAIDNRHLQLQMKTRGRGYYSTITEVALKMKASDELLTVDGTVVSHNISTASLGAVVTEASNYVQITFPTPVGDSYIKIYTFSYGLSIQVYGIGYIFGGSEGMLGSWDNGGVNFRDGTAFDLSGGYNDVKARSFELAQDWSVPIESNYLPNPSDVCVPESICVAGDTDPPCDGTRRLEDEVIPKCDKSCFTSPFVDMCFADLALSIDEAPCSAQFALGSPEILQCYTDLESKKEVDKSWACQETYVNPVIVQETLANFRPQGSEMCMANDDVCARLGGYCAPDCEDGPSTVCVPGLCSSAKPAKEMSATEQKGKKGPEMEEYDKRLKKGMNDGEGKMPKASKTPKATKSPKSSVECMCKVEV